MVQMTYKFYSIHMGREVDVQIILPTQEKKSAFRKEEFELFYSREKCKVLYLLHGGFGNSSDWVTMSPIAYLVRKKHMMVVMPSGENSYYQDLPYGPAYFQFVADELPMMIQKMFPVVSDRREDTYVAGLSMGGYGAFRLALARPERFCKAASLSGVLDLAGRIRDSKGQHKDRGLVFSDNFFDEDHIGDADLFTLMRKRKAEGTELPELFFTVGTEDFVYPYNQEARKVLEECGIAHHYEEHPGDHNWDYWNVHIKTALEWMGLL